LVYLNKKEKVDVVEIEITNRVEESNLLNRRKNVTT